MVGADDPDTEQGGVNPGTERDRVDPGTGRDGDGPGTGRDGDGPGTGRDGDGPGTGRDGDGPGAGRDGDAIVATAWRLAEAEGWAAVTARRLAERADVDLGELYQRFADRDAVVAAVAVRGFADLAAALTAARTAVDRPPEMWPAVMTAYLDFAYANPEIYDAMFAYTPDLTLGAEQVPETVAATSDELRAALAPMAAGRDPDTLTELGWSLLHGLVMLTRGGRLRPEAQEQREHLLTTHLFPPP
ncbi:TetR/AcrR family transcriptional regulator [Micromonospora sonchi]|uniref:TetR/AcrR family transcriptional regulator n=1 Tax=Micromonospora sonchi TaxID=1763543 RepID=UPI001E585477|nr:TetR/AcrR family transcriptional regulator [Micromonospora sonchi]